MNPNALGGISEADMTKFLEAAGSTSSFNETYGSTSSILRSVSKAYEGSYKKCVLKGNICIGIE